MLSFNYLGHLGQLGNQMFQYAAIRGISEYHGYDYMLPKKNHMNKISLYDCFDLPNLDKKIQDWSSFTARSPKNPNYDEDFLVNCPEETDLFAYFASEKYFKHAEDLVREDYKFKKTIIDTANLYYDKMFYHNDVISLHIRRTDSLNHDIIRSLDLSYYEKCLGCFESFLPVFVFSDDIEWCKSQDLFSGPRFKFSENNNNFVDMCLMSMCKYHIIANSSFSWWGAWLAKSKKVIAPKEWYSKKYMEDFTNFEYFPYPKDAEWSSKDICPNEWILA